MLLTLPTLCLQGSSDPAVTAQAMAIAQQAAAATLAKALGTSMPLATAPGALAASGAPHAAPARGCGGSVSAEVVINDASAGVRMALTKRANQDELSRRSGVHIATRGRFVAGGSAAVAAATAAATTPDERPLFLIITPAARAGSVSDDARWAAVNAAVADVHAVMAGTPINMLPLPRQPMTAAAAPAVGQAAGVVAGLHQPQQQQPQPQLCLQPQGQGAGPPPPAGAAAAMAAAAAAAAAVAGAPSSGAWRPSVVSNAPTHCTIFVGFEAPPEWNLAARIRGPGVCRTQQH